MDREPFFARVAPTGMDIEVSFPGGRRVDARVGSHVVQTDQPPSLGGTNSAPSPFDLFLASIATCAGIYALGFCQSRGLSTEGLGLRQRVVLDPATHLPSGIALDLRLPATFPATHVQAIGIRPV